MCAEAHGVMMNATPMESSMATDAPTGIGACTGPIRPRTKAMGRIAAITVSVARISGLPTSVMAPVIHIDDRLVPVFG